MEHEPDDERPLLRSTRLPQATAAPLRSSTGDHRTRAQELREALDDLRAELEDGDRRGGSRRQGPREPSDPPDRAEAADSSDPPGATGRPGRLRRLALVAAVAVVVVAGATGIVRVVAWSMAAPVRSASGPGSPAPEPVPAPASATVPGPTAAAPTSTASSTAPPPAPALTAPPGLPSSGPGADAPGAELVAVVAAGADGRGVVEVYERLVVRPGTTSVRLAAAPSAGLPPGLRRLRTTVTDLQVALDGRPATARAGRSGWDVTAPPGTTFARVELRYRLSGALVRPTPAPPGRRTLLLRPLAGPAAAATRDPVLVRLADRRVGSLYCPAAPRPLCGVASGSVRVATVPAGVLPIVLAQVTLG